MNYLIGMIVVLVAMGFFLRVLSIFQRGQWPSENVSNFAGALWELMLGRRVSR
jgi:hypothetical protein